MGRTAIILAVLVCLLALWLSSPPAFAQARATGEVRGIVVDPSNAVVPAAKLQAKDLATGIVSETVSVGSGAYAFLSLQPGVYDLSATAQGFQTTVLTRVVVETGRVLDLNIQLTVGQVAETVEVTGVAPMLQTTTNTVATTVRNDFVQNLPLSGRDTLQFAALMAGAQSPGEGARNTTYNGLPNASLNITVDGINNNSQRFKSGGTSFFAFAPIRLDAIEEVSISSTGAGADAAAGGAMNVRFLTRRGTSQFHGRLFEQFENDALNANTFFNNARGQPKAKVRRNDYGGNLGGPLPIPGMKDKLFFFVNMEYAPRPGSQNRSASLLTASSQQGNFSYLTADGSVRSANVLSLAAGLGFPSRIDPSVQAMLSTINSSRANGTGLIPNVNSPNYETLQWVQPTNSDNIFPTARLDYQLNPKMAWHGTWNLRANTNYGTPVYPGLSGLFNGNKVTTYVQSNAFDWAISPTLLNSFSFGIQSSHEDFNQETSVYQWADYGHRRLAPPAIAGTTIATPIVSQTPWIRNNPVYNLNESVTWVRDKHTLSFGGSFLRTYFYETTWQNAGVLNYNLGVAAGDPISAALQQGLFPGIRAQDLAGAPALYALLTGRLSSVSGSRNVDEFTKEYKDFSPITNRFAFATGGVYFQDSYRATRELTLNFGLRWELSGAIHNQNRITAPPDLANFYGPSTGLFQPGALNGVADPSVSIRPYTYSGDKINPAPNFGFAWSPKFDRGVLGRLLGAKTVFRGSYGINYFDEGINTISNRMPNNPGTSQSVDLLPGMPGFSPGGLSLTTPLPAPAVNPPAFAFPLPQRLFTFIGGLLTTQPVMHTPYVQSWNFGMQREVGRGLVVEARYVGNKSTHVWHGYSLNETNIFENGFLQEFRNAQRNLQISASSGVANNFANRGLPGQAPLPIFEAAFGARGSQPALAAGSGFTSNTFLTPLQLGNAGTAANTLATNNIYYCRLVGSSLPGCAGLGFNAAGPYPINMFRPNPFVTGLTLLDDNSYSSYHGLQIELRKTVSHGLTLQANYTWSKALSDLFNFTSQDASDNYRTLRNRDLDKGPSAFDLRHVFTSWWTYDLPFGKGRAFANSIGWLDRIVGGWQISGIHRYNSGQVYVLTGNRNTFNNLGDSGVILNGITASELQRMLRTFRPGPNLNAAADARLTGPDGRPLPALLSVPSTPGQFGQFVYLYDTPLVVNNLALLKIVPITERVRFRAQLEGINAFNHPVLAVGTTNIDSTAFGQTTGVRVGARNVQVRLQLDW